MKKSIEGSKETIMRKDRIARRIEGQECKKKNSSRMESKLRNIRGRWMNS